MIGNVVFSVNGPVVTVQNASDFKMLEMVYVGERRLIGEVIGITREKTTIQVYESTTGLAPGAPVLGTGAPLSATLGPGILSNIYDGIERPLPELMQMSGAMIDVGANLPSLDEEKQWQVTLCVREGETLEEGQIYAVCPETPLIEHRCMVPPGLRGKVVSAAGNGLYRVKDTVVLLEDEAGRADALSKMAHPNAASNWETSAHHHASHYRAEGDRYAVSYCQGRHCGNSGRLRHWEDDDSAPACKVVRRRYYRLCGLRRTGQ